MTDSTSTRHAQHGASATWQPARATITEQSALPTGSGTSRTAASHVLAPVYPHLNVVRSTQVITAVAHGPQPMMERY